MLEAQSGLTGVEVDGKNPATSLLDNSAALNISVLRVFATGVEPELPLQVKEGVYNEVALKALDQVLADAAQRGLRLVLLLARNWGGPDSRAAFASWNGLASPDHFYTSEAARKAYRDHMAFMVNRVNTVNGKKYKDDPVIFSWNLMNEPRYLFNSTDDPCAKDPDKCTANLQSWIEEMSAYLKQLDPNHLVTVGEEGFWSKSSPNAGDNPQPDSGWAAATGQDFTTNHQIKTIDYGGIHIWPDNWNVTDQAWMQRWIDAHMAVARQMNKPLVIEEFGKNVTSQDPAVIEKERNPTFKTVMGALSKSLDSGDVLGGAKYWMADPVLVDASSPGWSNYSQDQVFFSSSTMKDIIAPAATQAANKKDPVPGCTPQGAANGQAASTAGRKLLSVPLA
ncbi:glycoside hydrolase [Chlorella sorokiniana]|uniref:mannan endo-1,4-beta-mannosidase n=1 Tax=Chlorella sorokiniana TaxID=3076 RepID=A0A2P6TNB4_CHLSO|nr:glycoside hydrolase [Chlorella sorokiniana]|eukprot:PRW50827.1 glycoside hydrolase [Chlorella sorokiniana]